MLHKNSTFSIVWEYNIDPKNKLLFEQSYGSRGDWHEFFKISEHYTGSYLHQGCNDPNTYLLVDKWMSKQSYINFIEKNSEAYHLLSETCKPLYESEIRIGDYISLG